MARQPCTTSMAEDHANWRVRPPLIRQPKHLLVSGKQVLEGWCASNPQLQQCVNSLADEPTGRSCYVPP